MTRTLVLAACLIALVPLACGTAAEDDFADRMTAEHRHDSPDASGAATAEPARPVKGETVAYATVGDKQLEGYLARPEEGAEGAPGIIVIQEWWGLNDNIRAMARRLAAEGYVALAVDLYEGQVASDSAGARRLMQAAMQRAESLEDNLRQAYGYLEQEQGAPRVGTIGWCFGGGWSLRTALLLPDDIDATVIYYGRLVTERDRLATLAMPVLGHFGSEDRGIPLESVREFENVLKDLGKDARIHVYEGANHAFANPSGTRYDAEAAERAWSRTLAFFEAHLKS